jgi:hypothetical protein
MVATDWTALGQTAIGAAAAIGGGFLGAWLQGHSQERIERQRQRERAAELIGVAWQLHIEAAPDMLALFEEEQHARRAVVDLMQRHEAVRAQMWMLAVWYPSEKVRNLAMHASEAIFDSLHASFGYIRSRFEKPGEDVSMEEAEQLYRETQQVLADLMRALQGS